MGVSVNPVCATPVLAGREGELLLVRIRIPSAQLENVLDLLAELPFPINPELEHGHPESSVEFPAYASRTAEIREALHAAGLDSVRIEIQPMLAALANTVAANAVTH